jgi:hypothetical protein
VWKHAVPRPRCALRATARARSWWESTGKTTVRRAMRDRGSPGTQTRGLLDVRVHTDGTEVEKMYVKAAAARFAPTSAPRWCRAGHRADRRGTRRLQDGGHVDAGGGARDPRGERHGRSGTSISLVNAPGEPSHQRGGAEEAGASGLERSSKQHPEVREHGRRRRFRWRFTRRGRAGRATGGGAWFVLWGWGVGSNWGAALYRLLRAGGCP